MKKIWYVLISMRPKQWTKNLVLFAGIVFSKRFLETGLVLRSFLGFAVFCMLSGAIYILNDLFDRKGDREHPTKRNRPIASGAVGAGLGAAIVIALMVVFISFSWFLGVHFFLLVLAFVIINGTYSILLRQIVILDVISISFSFLIRAGAGVYVLHKQVPDLELSPWLLICTLFLSLFLALCKRRNEFSKLDNAATHRNSLKDYSSHLLDQLVGISASATIISYSIYTVWPETVSKFGTRNLVFTIPFVVFGLMRYLYLVYSRQEGGDPSGVLLTEKAILIDVFLWFVATLLILLNT
ncbi:MAG: decaprenyl-phosphate phosphoribosyltransferase [Candidatus Krumholzibacteriota bacterium]|nr:decaprenyl-phosphate phosphoribosyltransferase [Candidatus Krumholzibacteriota bacterium]